MHAWQPVVGGRLGSRICEVAREVGGRCVLPANINKALASQDNVHRAALGWQASSVAAGNGGIALLAAYMAECFPNETWGDAAYVHLVQAAGGFNYCRPNASLFSGLAGLGFVTAAMPTERSGRAELQEGINGCIARLVPRIVPEAGPATLRNVRVHRYDIVYGAAGIAAYITSLPERLVTPDLAAAGAHVLRYLVSLTKPDPTSGLFCFIEGRNIHTPERLQSYPGGYCDTGLAHGVAGIVAVLALALQKGWAVGGMGEGLFRMAWWLADRRIESVLGIDWPTVIAPQSRKDKRQVSSRAAWCYGVPGISRALYLAGCALDDASLRRISVAALESLVLRPRREWDAISPNLCHGLAGVLHICTRMYQDVPSPAILSLARTLAEEIVSFYDETTILGFRDRGFKHGWYENPRLLEGAPGVALSLLAATQPVSPGWDRFFAIS